MVLDKQLSFKKKKESVEHSKFVAKEHKLGETYNIVQHINQSPRSTNILMKCKKKKKNEIKDLKTVISIATEEKILLYSQTFVVPASVITSFFWHTGTCIHRGYECNKQHQL